GIVAGVSGATGGSSFVLTAGLAGAIASALSMAVGAYLAERSTSEVAAANIAGERKELEEHPEEEREELSLFYQLKGVGKAQADELADRLGSRPDAMLQALVSEELGGVSTGGNPGQAALAAGLSTGISAMIPVLPFFWIGGTAGGGGDRALRSRQPRWRLAGSRSRVEERGDLLDIPGEYG